MGTVFLFFEVFSSEKFREEKRVFFERGKKSFGVGLRRWLPLAAIPHSSPDFPQL